MKQEYTLAQLIDNCIKYIEVIYCVHDKEGDVWKHKTSKIATNAHFTNDGIYIFQGKTLYDATLMLYNYLMKNKLL